MRFGSIRLALIGLVGTLVLAGIGSAFAQSASGPLSQEPYSVSYAAGGYDAAGHFLGGTELTSLTAYDGKLYAGIGYWMDRPNLFPDKLDPRSGAQIIVQDSRQSPWRLETSFDRKAPDGHFLYTRTSTMQIIEFHRFDAAGNVLGPLAQMFMVGLDGTSGAVFTRSAPGEWQDTAFPAPIAIRSLALHYDKTDKTEKLYAAGGVLEGSDDRPIYAGVYDPSAPGRIRWSPAPESAGFQNRVMSMVECNGTLFAAAKPSIAKRNDVTKTWELVYTYDITRPFDKTKFVSGFRSLTCIDDPADNGKRALLTGFEGIMGDIFRIDAVTGAAEIEHHSRDFFIQKWGGPPVRRDLIMGYNDVPIVKAGPPNVRLFGLYAFSPNLADGNAAWLLSRTAGNPPRYELHQVNPLSWPNRRSDVGLWSVPRHQRLALSRRPGSDLISGWL